ncbi:MAG TPA: HEAT repeat domain-containing protein [Gemmatimonadaceae bacterium]
MTMKLVGWAIIHSLWQGGVLALLSAGLLGMMRSSRPEARYRIALVTLILMFVLPVATTLSSSNDNATSGVTPSFSTSIQDPSFESAPVSSTTSSPDIPGVAPVAANDNAFKIDRDTIASWIDTSIPFLVAAWIVGLLLASARLIGGFARTRSITRRAANPSSRALEIRIAKLCDRLGIHRAIRAFESTMIDVPLVIGAVRPVIVVPMSLITGLTPLQLDMLLAHELAHVKRNDYLVNILQTVLETLLFYHPAARWISERAREERENCCDDIAIATCAVNPRDYTATLLVLEEARDQGFGLAAAANGGSLLRRAQRLLTGKKAYLDLGPRWIAGVITIGAALFAGNDAFAAIQASYLPISSIAVKSDSTGKRRGPDMSQAKPSAVIKSPAGGSLAERVRWAGSNSGSNDYWIGYLIAGDQSGKSKIYTSDLPVRLGGNTTFTGSMNLGNGDLSNFVFYGVPLAPLVGQHSPLSTAVFVRMKGGMQHVEQVHFGTFILPQYFANRPLVWLDSATDAESVSILSSLVSSNRDEDVQHDLVAAIGSHRDANTTLPVLLAILNSGRAEQVRQKAVEGIGRTGDPRAMAALSRTARTDRYEGVRREAIEAFARMQSPAASDTLIAFVSTLDDSDMRRDAVESLGDRNDDKAFTFLSRYVRNGDDSDLRRKAVEALAGMRDRNGMAIVIEVARTDRNADVRRQAVEEIGDHESPSRAFELLKSIASNDPDESVRSEAVETIAQVDDARSVGILVELANNSRSDQVQVEAVESLGETVQGERTIPVIREIARKHPVEEVRIRALETLMETGRSDAIEAIMFAIRNDRSENVRSNAIEALGDSKDPAALKALVSLINGKDPIDVRHKALEVYADAVSEKDAVAMLKRVAANDPSGDMRSRALDLLNDR